MRADSVAARKANAFALANELSPVVYGSVIGNGGEGCFYRLENGKTYELSAESCRLVEPRWAFETAA